MTEAEDIDTNPRIPKLRIVGFLNAYTQGVSGGDIWFVEVFKRLTKYHVCLLSPKSGLQFCKEKGLENYDTFEVRSRAERGHVFAQYLSRTYEAIKLLSHIHADVIYASSDFFPDVIPCLVYKVRHPDIIWVQKLYHLAPIRRIPAWLLQRISVLAIKWRADLVFVDNQHLADSLIKIGIRPDTVYVFQPGLNHKNKEADTSLLTHLRDGAIYLGRLHPAKGLEELLEIWAEVIREVPDARLRLVGPGDAEYVKRLETIVQSNGLTHKVEFLGYVSDEDARQALSSSRVFMTASSEEGFGISVMEALACQTPVVCWNISAFNEAFGSLVNTITKGDINGFAQTVIMLLSDDETLARAQTRISGTFHFRSWAQCALEEENLMTQQYLRSRNNVRS